MNSPDQYLKNLNSERNEDSRAKRGMNLSTTNNYVSQIGRDVSTDRINVRRTTKDYDVEQPDFLRVLENKKYHPNAHELAGKNGILTVLSKTRGWLTVTPHHTDRKAPID